MKNKIIKNTIIYFLLILGYTFLYVVDMEKLMNPGKEVESQSNVNFIYQQF